MKQIKAWINKHKTIAAIIGVGVAALLYWLYQSSQSAASSSSGATSSAALPVFTAYPSSAQGTTTTATPTGTTSGTTVTNSQLSAIQQSINALYAYDAAQMAAGTGGNTQQTGPVTTTSSGTTVQTGGGSSSASVSLPVTHVVNVAKPTQTTAPTSGNTANQSLFTAQKISPVTSQITTSVPVVLDRTPTGALVASTNYKQAVNTAQGLYQNHVWDPGYYPSGSNSFVNTKSVATTPGVSSHSAQPVSHTSQVVAYHAPVVTAKTIANRGASTRFRAFA